MPQLIELLPVLQQPFYLLGSHRVAENVWYTDWNMPCRSIRLRVVQRRQDLEGIDGRDKVLWECPDGYHMLSRRILYRTDDGRAWSEYDEVRTLARHRGFEIKPTVEFVTWLKKHMQDLVQARRNDGLHVLVQSLHKKQ